MRNLIISEEVIHIAGSQRKISNPVIVIYRDVAKFGCWYSAKPISFVPKAKLIDETKLNEYFVFLDGRDGIQIWVEKALKPIIMDQPVLISMNTGLLKGLELSIGPEILKKQ